jgi:hypothetical protein
MKFNRSQAVSFKSVTDGDYVGVLVGFSYVGMHETKDWGSKPKIMLRWELHDLDPPHHACVDDEGLIYVVTQNFPATIQGESSWLYKCLLAHGIAVPGGGCTDSKEWHGKVAKLTIENATGSRSDRTFMNVIDINPLDHDVNIKPTLKYEHWEPEDETVPPIWAKFMIEKSSDIWQLASQIKTPAPVARPGPSGRLPGPAANQGRYYPPSNPSSDYRAPEADEDDIPF